MKTCGPFYWFMVTPLHLMSNMVDGSFLKIAPIWKFNLIASFHVNNVKYQMAMILSCGFLASMKVPIIQWFGLNKCGFHTCKLMTWGWCEKTEFKEYIVPHPKNIEEFIFIQCSRRLCRRRRRRHCHQSLGPTMSGSTIWIMFQGQIFGWVALLQIHFYYFCLPLFLEGHQPI